jgi:hypothetical protein
VPRAGYTHLMTIRGLGVAAVFLVGCAVGGVSSQLVVPRASAQQATLTKWEHRCAVPPWAEMNSVSTHFGAEGWELLEADGVGDGTILLCFKRPKM